MANRAQANSARLAAEKAKKREADAEKSRQRVKKRLMAPKLERPEQVVRDNGLEQICRRCL
jgi:phage antirepressor YoqD-like protein